MVELAHHIFSKVTKETQGLIKNKDIKSFISDLGIVFVFRVVTAILSVVIMVLAARYFGVVAVGDIVIIQNISYIITIPMTLGINTSIIKYFPQREQDQGRFVGTVLICNLIIGLTWMLIYTMLGRVLSGIVNLSWERWLLSVMLAVTINWSTLFESILRAKKEFFRLSTLKVIGAMIYFAIILYSCLVKEGYYYFIFGLAINQGIFSVLACRRIGLKRIGFSFKLSKELYRYGAINMVSGGLSAVLFNMDLFIVNRVCTPYDVGIYSAYQVNVKNFFNIMFHDIFAAVFLPTIAKMEKIKIYNKIMGYLPLLCPAVILGNGGLCITVLLLYGKNYPIHWLYILLVSVGTGLHCIYWMFHSVFSIEGERGALICALVLGIPLPVLLATCILLTKNYGMVGTMVSWLVTQVMLIGVFVIIIKYKYQKKEEGVAL